MACPFMPNPTGAGELDAYARWIGDALVARTRSEVRCVEDPAHTYLCGVSLGGYVALEVFLRASSIGTRRTEGLIAT